jgi:hypothetical protein
MSINRSSILFFAFLLGLLSSCRDKQKHVEEKIILRSEEQVNEPADPALAIVDSLYTGIANGDSATVVALFHSQGRLLGSDPDEDWELNQIRTYMHERSVNSNKSATIEVVKRRVMIHNEMMLVDDRLKISTVSFPFRCVTMVREDSEGRKIHFSEFSALIRNADLTMLDSLLSTTGK